MTKLKYFLSTFTCDRVEPHTLFLKKRKDVMNGNSSIVVKLNYKICIELRKKCVIEGTIYLKTQQLPNPCAQFPSLVPPLSLHSLSEKHVPFKVASDLA